MAYNKSLSHVGILWVKIVREGVKIVRGGQNVCEKIPSWLNDLLYAKVFPPLPKRLINPPPPPRGE